MGNGLRVVNLEEGKPFVDAAIRRLTYELAHSKKTGCAVPKIIHGYGSSGKGGKIRIAARRELETLQKRGYVKAIIYGEKLSIFDEDTRRALAHCGELRGDPDFERHNNGVTLIML